MTPEQVLSLLVARTLNIDPGRPDPLVQQASEGRRGRARPSNWRLAYDDNGKIDFEKSWPTIRTAEGKSSRSVVNNRISDIAAIAFSGMPQRHSQALHVAVRLQDGSRNAIFARLHTVAERSKSIDGFWVDRIRRGACACGRQAAQDYVPDLIELAIRELEDPKCYASQQLRADWFGVSRSTWLRSVQRPYDRLSGTVWSWYHAGIGHLQNRLNQRNLAVAHT